IISEWMGRHTLEQAMEVMLASGAAAAPIYSVKDVVNDEHFQVRQSIVAVDDPVLGKVRMQAPTPRLSDSPGGIKFTGPKLGQHNNQIYGDLLGLDAPAIQALAADQII